jgi:tRNA pseudouridine55 synthase
VPRPSRRQDGPALSSGVLIIDKPPHVTSHDVVAAVRRHTGGAKIGHTGTLDPFATGVLPLVIGKATRLAQHLSAGRKAYEADVRLGRTTDTFDITGRVLSEADPEACRPSPAAVEEALSTFRGTWMQTPPAFSAKHVDGARAYEQARRGVAVDLPPVEVTVWDLSLLSMDRGLIRVRLVCSAGFYVRSFAEALGRTLGPGACLEALRRTQSGGFGLDAAIPLERVLLDGPAAHVRPLGTMLTDWPAVTLTAEGVDRVGHGREVGPAQLVGPALSVLAGGRTRLLGPDGALLALAEARPDGSLRPSVVLM